MVSLPVPIKQPLSAFLSMYHTSQLLRELAVPIAAKDPVTKSY
jgi:hypothetical protein